MDINNPIGMKSLEPSQSPFIMNPSRFVVASATFGDDFKVIASGANASNDLLTNGNFDSEVASMTWSQISTGSSAGSWFYHINTNEVDTSGAYYITESYNTSCTYGAGTKGISATVDLTGLNTISYSYKIPNIAGVTNRIYVGGVSKKVYSSVVSSYTTDTIDVSGNSGNTVINIYADRAACGVMRNTNFYISNFRISS